MYWLTKHHRVCTVRGKVIIIFLFLNQQSMRERSFNPCIWFPVIEISVDKLDLLNALLREVYDRLCSVKCLKVPLALMTMQLVRWLLMVLNKHNDSFLQCYKNRGKNTFFEKYQKLLYGIILIKLINKPFTNILL